MRMRRDAMDWLILIVFAIIMGIMLGVLDLPEAFKYVIVVVTMAIYAYVYTRNSEKDD